MENLNSDSSEGSEKKSKKIIWILIIIFSLGLILLFSVLFNSLRLEKQGQVVSQNQNVDEEVADGNLTAEPANLDLFVNYSENIKLFSYDSETNQKKDITNEADWESEDSQIIFIANQGVKGQIMAREEGVTQVVATFNGESIKIPVKISKNELKVVCAPLVYDKDTGNRNKTKELEEGASVGDKIKWMIVYEKIGAPNYLYKWSGDNNLEGDGATIEVVYNTSGIKKAKIWTQDTVGLTAEDECQIEIFD